MSNPKKSHWLAIALVVSVLFNVGTIYYSFQAKSKMASLEQQLTTLQKTQMDTETRAEERQKDLENEATGFSRLLGGSK